MSLLRGMCSLEMLVEILNYFEQTFIRSFTRVQVAELGSGVICFSWIPLMLTLGSSVMKVQTSVHPSSTD